MNEESRDKKKIFEIISKNRLLFAFAGCIVAIIAFFTPMFYYERFITWVPYFDIGSLWIFGLYEHSSTFAYVFDWFGEVEAVKFVIALISIVSTVLTSALVLGTLFTASITLIKKRKKGVHSSRLLLYFSTGLFVIVNLYMFAMEVLSLENDQNFYWVPQMPTPGAYLFYIGSVLILLGFTVKLKLLLKIVPLFVAVGFIHLGAAYLVVFFWALEISPPIDQAALMFHINRDLIPGIIHISIALVIVITDVIIIYMLHKRAKRNAAII